MSQPPSQRTLSPYSSGISMSGASSPMQSYEGPTTTAEQATSGGYRGRMVHAPSPYLHGVKFPPSYQQRQGNDVDHRFASHPQATPSVHSLVGSVDPARGVSMDPRLTGEHAGPGIPTSDIVKQLDFATNENIRLRKRLEENNTILDKKIEEFQQLCQLKERLQQEASESTNKFFEARVAILGFKCRNLQLQGELDSHRSGQPAPSTLTSQQQQQSDNGKLREQLDRLQSDNTQLRQQVERFRSESGQLREQLQRAPGRGGREGSQLRSLQQDVGSLRLENTNLQGVIRELQSDIASLENKERIHSEEIKRFTQEKQMLEERCHKLSEESSHVRSQFAYQQSASVELERLRNELSRYQQMASDFHHLQSQVSTLQRQLQEKQQDLSHLTERNHTLQYKISELDGKLREKLSGSTPSGPIPKPRTNIQNLGAQVERLQKEKDSLEEQLQRERQARSASEGQLHTTTVKTQELSLENAQLRNQMEQLSGRSQGAPPGGEDEIRRLQEEVESRELEIRSLEQQKNEAELRCRELQGQFDVSVREKEREDRRSREFVRLRREMEGQIAAVHEEKEAEKSAKMKLETKVASLEEQNRLLRETQKGPMSVNIAFKLNEAMGQLKAAECERQQLQQDKELLMKDNSRLDEEIRKLREENEIKARQVGEVEVLKAQSEHYSRQMSQLQQEKETEIMASRQREEESISQKLVLQSQVDEYRCELTRQKDQYDRQLFAKKEELGQLREQIASLQEAFSNMEHSQTDVQSKQQQIEQLQRDLQKQREEHHSLWTQQSELQASHDQVTTKHQELAVELSQAQRAISEYQGECEALMQDYQSCAGRLRSAEEDRDKYKKQMDIGMRELTKRADRIKQLEQQRDGAQERVQHMEYQLKQYMDDFNRERVAREEAVEVKKMLEREKAEYQRRMADLRTQLNMKAEVSLREDQFPGSVVDQQSTQSPDRRSPFQSGMMGGGGGSVMVGGMIGSGGGGGGRSAGVQPEPSLQHSGEQSYLRNITPGTSDSLFRRSHEQQFWPPHTQADTYPLPPPPVRHDVEIPRAKVEPPIPSDVPYGSSLGSSSPPPPLPPRDRRDRPATDWRSDSSQFMAGTGQLLGIHQPQVSQAEFVGGLQFPATIQRPSTTSMGGPVGGMSGGMMGGATMGGPVGRTMGGPGGATMGGPVGRTMGGPGGATMGGPVGRTMGGPGGATMGGPVGRTMGGPGGATMGGPGGATMGGPVGRTMGGPVGRIGVEAERSMASAMPVLNDLNVGIRPPTSNDLNIGTRPPTSNAGSIRAQAGNKWAAPGEVFDENPPAMDCPICGRNDFKTQTDLELHSAQCN